MRRTQVQYNIGGMSCSFCTETVNKAYDRTDGVDDVDVNLNCGGCADRVTDALDEWDGVRGVSADAQRVEVTFNPHPVSVDDLRDAVSDLGYTVEVGGEPHPAD